ncbi:MAG: type I methionyl aminopeptidase [Christensenellales bacterium]
MIILKSREQIELMRAAGRIVAGALEQVGRAVKSGVTTQTLDAIARDYILQKGGIPSFLGYNGFPANICTSVNEQVVHGIPGKYRLREGDIVGVDIGVVLSGWQGDAARTFAVGEISPQARKLMDVTKQSFFKALEVCIPGKRLGDIGWAVQSCAEANGFSVVRDLCGHGIGQNMHEDPQVLNYGSPGRGERLQAGMVLAIEPMINAGGYKVYVPDNDWPVLTADGAYSAHYENTVAITDNGPEILTVLEE